MTAMTWLLLSAFGVYGGFLVVIFVAMCQPPVRFGRFMRHFPMPLMAVLPFPPLWNIARGGRLRVGDPAPDFSLKTIDRSRDVVLSSFRGRQPVVLVFGSYT